MASRKSCTHLTWAEAKASAGGSNGAGSSKKKPNFKKVDHGKALVAKTVAKNISQEDIDREKAMLRRERKAEERATAAAAKRAEEKEREKLERYMKPFDVAMQRLSTVCKILQEKTRDDERNEESIPFILDKKRVAECRELQMNEIMSLEAIYLDTDDFFVSDASDIETLQSLLEQYQMEPNNEETLASICNHPEVSFTLQINFDGALEATRMTMLLLINITLPKLYPLDEDTPPLVEIPYFMAVDRNSICNPDKPVETLAHLEESLLIEDMTKTMTSILPDPCVYEVISSWLIHRIFDYTQLSAHAQLSF